MPDTELYAFEPFSSLAGVLNGQAIKIMPVGTFYRGDRKLTITAQRLQDIAANTLKGLPRFRIPINENHGGVGKVGTVSEVAYLPAGPDGEGLYATKYELTDQGKGLVESKRFDAVSPEVMWTLKDGTKYQDPQTGEHHDNVLVGLALTDRPFFGHDNVALFSAIEPKGAEIMPDPIIPVNPPAPEPEKFTISADEFKAFKAKSEEFDRMAQMVGEMKRAGRVKDITTHVKEAFSAIPVPADELAEKFAALDAVDPKLYEYFDGLLATLDRQVSIGDLFGQTASALPGGNAPDTFDAAIDKVVAEKFNGDRSHYAEAMTIARKENPALAAKYETQYSVRPSKTQARA